MTDFPSAPKVSVSQLHEILQILARAAALPGSLQTRRNEILDSIATFLSADNWTWDCHQPGMEPDSPPEGAALITSRTMADGRTTTISFFRQDPGGVFCGPDTLLVSLIFEEVPWLFEQCDLGKSTPDFHLSRREANVLELLVEGNSRTQIADGLALSEHTVSDYVKSLFCKLGVNSHSQLLSLALREKLSVTPDKSQ